MVFVAGNTIGNAAHRADQNLALGRIAKNGGKTGISKIIDRQSLNVLDKLKMLWLSNNSRRADCQIRRSSPMCPWFEREHLFRAGHLIDIRPQLTISLACTLSRNLSSE
jgi:hypothetical protein